jgi:hypothetical protein
MTVSAQITETRDTDRRLDTIRSRIAATPKEDARARVLLVLAHEVLRRRGLDRLIAAPPAEETPDVPAIAWSAPGELPPYAALVGRISASVEAAVPLGARVLVVSKGDEQLLRLGARTAQHFPQSPDGGYSGYHPTDGWAVLAELHAHLQAGAEFLVIPATACWWLEHYPELALYLETAPLTANESCAIFDIRPERRQRRPPDGSR